MFTYPDVQGRCDNEGGNHHECETKYNAKKLQTFASRSSRHWCRLRDSRRRSWTDALRTSSEQRNLKLGHARWNISLRIIRVDILVHQLECSELAQHQDCAGRILIIIFTLLLFSSDDKYVRGKKHNSRPTRPHLASLSSPCVGIYVKNVRHLSAPLVAPLRYIIGLMNQYTKHSDISSIKWRTSGLWSWELWNP